MSRNIKSLQLLQVLTPLVNLGIITGPTAKNWTESYKKGSTEEIRHFISMGRYPMKYECFIEEVENFLGND